MDISKYQRDNAFREINHLMPELQFPASWRIRVIWPFGGAAARLVLSWRLHRMATIIRQVGGERDG